MKILRNDKSIAKHIVEKWSIIINSFKNLATQTASIIQYSIAYFTKS